MEVAPIGLGQNKANASERLIRKREYISIFAYGVATIYCSEGGVTRLSCILTNSTFIGHEQLQEETR